MIEGSLVYYQSEIEVDSSENFLIALGQEKKAASLDVRAWLLIITSSTAGFFPDDDDDGSYRYSLRHFAFRLPPSRSSV